MGKDTKIQIENAKQNSKGGPRDGNGQDRVTPSGQATRSPYTNPASGKESTDNGVETTNL